MILFKINELRQRSYLKLAKK